MCNCLNPLHFNGKYKGSYIAYHYGKIDICSSKVQVVNLVSWSFNLVMSILKFQFIFNYVLYLTPLTMDTLKGHVTPPLIVKWRSIGMFTFIWVFKRENLGQYNIMIKIIWIIKRREEKKIRSKKNGFFFSWFISVRLIFFNFLLTICTNIMSFQSGVIHVMFNSYNVQYCIEAIN